MPGGVFRGFEGGLGLVQVASRAYSLTGVGCGLPESTVGQQELGFWADRYRECTVASGRRAGMAGGPSEPQGHGLDVGRDRGEQVLVGVGRGQVEHDPAHCFSDPRADLEQA